MFIFGLWRLGRWAARRKPSGRRPGQYGRGAGLFLIFFIICVIVGMCHGGS